MIAAWGLMLLCASLASAGILVDRHGNGFIGNITVGKTVQVTVPNGQIDLARQDVAWVIANPKINTFLAGYYRVTNLGSPLELRRQLLQLSIANEPATRALALNLLRELRQTEAALTREPRVVRRTEGPSVGTTISVENSSFLGFIDYSPGEVTTVGPGGTTTVPNRIRQPVFSSIGVNSSVIIGTGGSAIIQR